MDGVDPYSKKPEDSDFQQQRLRAWQPLLTPQWVVSIFLLVGAAFLPIGGVIYAAQKNVVELEYRYDNVGWMGNCTNLLTRVGCNQTITINITDDMSSPVFFYYKLTNFYQNHRRYVSSRSDAQLRGDSGPAIDSCTPFETDPNGRVYYPCGLVAYSFFNDTFWATLSPNDGSGPLLLSGSSWQKRGIAWPTDVNSKFAVASYSLNSSTVTTIGPNNVPLPSVTDEEFMVWMRTAGLPTFRKLYRIIYRDLHKGDVLTVTVSNVYPVSRFNGEKAIVLSTTSFLGGKNSFLGIAYLVVGSLCVFLAILFFLKDRIAPRKLGEMP